MRIRRRPGGDHDTLWPAGRSGREDNIGRVVRFDCGWERFGRFLRYFWCKGVRHLECGLGLGQHVGDAFLRIVIVYRDIDRAGLHDAQHADDDVDGASGSDGNGLAGGHTAPDQPARQPAGGGFDRGIGQASGSILARRCLGPTRCRRFDKLGDRQRAIGKLRRTSSIPGPFRRRQHGERRQAASQVRDKCVERVEEMLQHPLDPGLVEQIGRIFDVAGHGRVVEQRIGQVALGGLGVDLLDLDIEARQGRWTQARLQQQLHAVERIARSVALALDGIDDMRRTARPGAPWRPARVQPGARSGSSCLDRRRARRGSEAR